MYRLRMDGDYGAFDPRSGYYLGGADEPGVRVVVSRLFDWRQAVVVVARPPRACGSRRPLRSQPHPFEDRS